jgi:glycosyltransferase involved in cell wall biosynthesis
MLDVLLMPSRVRESFGLAAREALSLGQSCIVRPSGALAEIQGCRGVVTADEGDNIDSLMLKLDTAKSRQLPPWQKTSITDYVDKLLSL